MPTVCLREKAAAWTLDLALPYRSREWRAAGLHRRCPAMNAGPQHYAGRAGHGIDCACWWSPPIWTARCRRPAEHLAILDHFSVSAWPRSALTKIDRVPKRASARSRRPRSKPAETKLSGRCADLSGIGHHQHGHSDPLPPKITALVAKRFQNKAEGGHFRPRHRPCLPRCRGRPCGHRHGISRRSSNARTGSASPVSGHPGTGARHTCQQCRKRDRDAPEDRLAINSGRPSTR